MVRIGQRNERGHGFGADCRGSEVAMQNFKRPNYVIQVSASSCFYDLDILETAVEFVEVCTPTYGSAFGFVLPPLESRLWIRHTT